jgi:hypothetical protein
MRRRHRMVDEPLSFNWGDIVELLESAGYERFAAEVRRLGRANSDMARLDREWREKYAALYERLIKYEPPKPPVVDRNGKPGPMSDG